MKFRRRVAVVVFAALMMAGLVFLLPVINRTNSIPDYPPVQFDHPNLTVVSLPVVPPPEMIDPEKNESEPAIERPELETAPESIEIKIDETVDPLAVAISDDDALFVPLVAFDMFDLDQHPGPLQANARGHPLQREQGDIRAWARIQFVVEADGTVSQARIDAASDRDFGEAGLDAIRNRRFAGMNGEQSVRTWLVQPFPLRTDN